MATTDLDNTTWNLTAYLDGGALRALPVDAEVSLMFQGSTAGGKSACNRYHGNVTIGEDTLTFGQLLSTKMACQPPLMEIEQAYLRALDSVARWHLADGDLELRDGTGRALLVFARA